MFRKLGSIFGEAGGYYQATRSSPDDRYAAPGSPRAGTPKQQPFDTMDFDDDEEARLRGARPPARGMNPAARQNAIGMLCCVVVTVMMFLLFFIPE